MAITPETPGSIDAPNDLVGEAAIPAAIPNTVPAKPVEDVAIPNTLNGEAGKSVV